MWPTLISDPMLDLDIQELANLTTGGGDLENFERLFSKLKEMKGNYLSTFQSSHVDAFLVYMVAVVAAHFVMARLDSELWA